MLSPNRFLAAKFFALPDLLLMGVSRKFSCSSTDNTLGGRFFEEEQRLFLVDIRVYSTSNKSPKMMEKIPLLSLENCPSLSKEYRAREERESMV